MNTFDYSRLLAWLTSVFATLGSLYFSEIQGFIPCELCWYQRILMYPLIIILGIGFYKKDRNSAYYVIPLSIIGMGVSLVHYLHQKTDLFKQAIQCTQGVPCSGQYINWLGFMTIPFLAFLAFLMITLFVSYSLKEADQETE